MNPTGHFESLQQKTTSVFGVSLSLEGVRRLLNRRGLRYIAPRPHHSKADFEAQQLFREAFPEVAKKILLNGLALERVWISFRTSPGLDNSRC